MSFTKPALVPKHVIYGFFLLGLVSSVAFRTIILFQQVEPSWVRPAWYTGVVGYLFFFLYRYRISKKRKKAIDDFALIKKVRSGTALTEEDREVLAYLLLSIKSSLEDVNYAMIFLFSILAILADIALTLLK